MQAFEGMPFMQSASLS